MTYPHNQNICDHVPDIQGSHQMDYSYIHAMNNENNSGLYPQQYYSSYSTLNDKSSFDYCDYSKIDNTYDKNNNDSISHSDNNFDDTSIEKIYKEIHEECEHFILKSSCKECNNHEIS